MLIDQVHEEKVCQKRKDYVPLLSQYWNATYTARALTPQPVISCTASTLTADRNLLHCFYSYRADGSPPKPALLSPVSAEPTVVNS